MVFKNIVPNGLAEVWNKFIDWEKRRKGEGDFLVSQLNAFRCRKILNAALGDGCDTIYLLKEGFEVENNEIDPAYFRKAIENATRYGFNLKITNYDWRDFQSKFQPNIFDAVLVLGNSLTFLFKKRDQIKALKGFKYILRDGGILIIDERNYQYMLDNPIEAISNFRYSRKYVYCGDTVTASPVKITNSEVVMRYVHKNGTMFFLKLYPFRKDELKTLLHEAGFRTVLEYSDYEPVDDHNSDFRQYIAVK